MTIVRLTSDHHQDVLQLFGDEAANYYFLINDLLDHGYAGESFRLFGEYSGGKLQSMLLNNERNLTYFSPADRDIDIYRDVLKQCQYDKLSGPGHMVSKVMPYVKVKSDTLCKLGMVKTVIPGRQRPELSIKTVRTEHELGQLYDLLTSADEYTLNVSRDEYIAGQREALHSTQSRTVFLNVDGRMVASCATVRESANSAIVVGVVTHPDYRGKGYASEVLIELFTQLLAEGKYPYLFYNNPAARSVYLKLGMTEVCEWRVVMVG